MTDDRRRDTERAPRQAQSFRVAVDPHTYRQATNGNVAALVVRQTSEGLSPYCVGDVLILFCQVAPNSTREHAVVVSAVQFGEPHDGDTTPARSALSHPPPPGFLLVCFRWQARAVRRGDAN